MEVEKPFKCNICTKSYLSRQTLRVHLKLHINKKTHSCDYCHKNFSSKNSLTDHTRLHTGELYNCDLCNNRYNTSQALIEHVATHINERPYKCNQCDVKFTTPRSRMRHIANKHPDSVLFACSLCNRNYVSENELNTHMTMHIKKTKPDVVSDVVSVSSKLNTRITKRAKNPYKCNMCDRKFYYEFTFEKHLMLHTREKKFECTFCNKYFSRKSSLSVHIKKHDVEKTHTTIHAECDDHLYSLRKHAVVCKVEIDTDMPNMPNMPNFV